jgi:exonuclease III
MIVASLNVRGVGGSLKSMSLSRFLEKNKPDVLFIQETMVGATKAREVFAKILPNWYFCGVDSIGLSGGLLSAWNPRKANFKAFLTKAGILLEGVVKDTNIKVRLINCYGPYADRVGFWEDLKRIGIFNEENLILGGDLNFTTSSREVWGAKARVDPLQLFFSHLVQNEGLVDVEPIKILLTWRNGRKGQDYIAKRLDRFLIYEKLVSLGIRYRSWICNDKISDHMPIMLQLDFGSDIVRYPFKFNVVWLEDQDFVSMVRTSWVDLLGTEVLTPMDIVGKKIKKTQEHGYRMGKKEEG